MENLLRGQLCLFSRAGERVGKGGDGACIEPANLRGDYLACGAQARSLQQRL